MFGTVVRTTGAVALGLIFSLAVAAAEGDKPAADKSPAKEEKKEEKKEPKVQTTCPVMGGKINKEIYVDHDGKRIFLCCKACVAEFGKDSAKYIKKLEDDGVTLEKAPAKEEPKEDGKDQPAAKSATEIPGGCGGCQGGAKAGGCCP